MSLAVDVVESDSMLRAKELLDLIKSPTAVATGVLLTFAQTQLTANNPMTRDRTLRALSAAAAGSFIAGLIFFIMAPLGWRVLFENSGNSVETRLVVYVLMWAVALGTFIFGLKILQQALRDWQAIRKVTREGM